MKKITQLHYPDLEIDSSEKDIIQIWQKGKEESNVIQIEREIINEFVSSLPVSSVNNKEPDGYIKENHKFISREEYLSDPDDYIIEMWQPVYFSPVPSNRIGVEELKEWIEITLSAESKLGASDEVIKAYLNVKNKINSLSVSDEVKKPIDEITDEDLMAACKIEYGEGYQYLDDPEIVAKKLLNDFDYGVKAYQYLQSKNYQLPKYY